MLHITAPKQHLYVPDASWAFKLSFHSSPQSAIRSVLVLFWSVTWEGVRAVPWLFFDFSACWLIRQLQILLAQSLLPMGIDSEQVFPVSSQVSSLIPLQNVFPLCLKFKWKSQVRLSDGQCDHVTGGQKHCTTQYKRESIGDLAVGKFCFALLS